MKILYVASRINASDGSSVHCRAFVDHVSRIGHEIQTFPQMKDQPDKPWVPASKSGRNIAFYLKRMNFQTLKGYLAAKVRLSAS